MLEPPPPPAPFAADHVVVTSYPRELTAPVTTASLAAALGAFLAAEVGPCVVSGHSMGAMVALHLAADHPGLVRGLVLSAAVARADEAVVAALGGWEVALTQGRHLDFHRDAITAAYVGRERDDRLALLEAAPPPRPSAASVARHVALSRAARGHDATERLGAVGVPTLVLAGAHDPICRPDRSRELAAALPDARFEVIAEGAHGFPEQCRTRYTSALDGFIHQELSVGERT